MYEIVLFEHWVINQHNVVCVFARSLPHQHCRRINRQSCAFYVDDKEMTAKKRRKCNSNKVFSASLLDDEEANDNEFYNFSYLKSVPISSHFLVLTPVVVVFVCWFLAVFTHLHLLRVPWVVHIPRKYTLEIIHIEYSACEETNKPTLFRFRLLLRFAKEKWIKLVELKET